jgi:hypothetical protein
MVPVNWRALGSGFMGGLSVAVVLAGIAFLYALFFDGSRVQYFAGAMVALMLAHLVLGLALKIVRGVRRLRRSWRDHRAGRPASRSHPG